jgi:hypothetical protein
MARRAIGKAKGPVVPQQQRTAFQSTSLQLPCLGQDCFRPRGRTHRLYSASSFAMTPRPLRHFGKAFPVSAVFGLMCVACAGQTVTFSSNPTRYLVCDHGDGSFRGNLPRNAPAHDVTVSVSSTRQNSGFATHTCLAELTWNGNNLNVTRDAAQADIDVMGADLGLGALVVAFQVKATDADPTIQYKIYALSTPPRLLRTITGQDYFSAADTRLDGTVEIWTTDAAAVNGFENLPRSAFDAAPAVILRFQNEKLFDVSSEFRPYYDHQIELLRSHLDPQQLSAFEKSDGKLSNETLPAHGPARGLLATKIKVLEIVWAYLYSDREQDAWHAVSTMWPQSDQSRIIAAIRAAQARGMRTQVDGVSHQPPAAPEHAAIYTNTAAPGLNLPEKLRKTVADSIPQHIVLMTSPPHNAANWAAGRDIVLVTDEAGKVRSAKMKTNSEDETNKGWLDAAAGWKYIPAFRDGQPSAFRWKLHVQRDR